MVTCLEDECTTSSQTGGLKSYCSIMHMAFILRFSRTGNVMQQETVTSLLGFGVERHLHNLKPVQE